MVFIKRKILFSGAILLLTFLQTFAQKEKTIAKVWNAAGGKAIFEKSRYIQFTFASERNGTVNPGRKHLWDRYTGDYRLEYVNPEGRKTVVLFNVNTQQGKSFEEGVLLPDSTNVKLIKRANAAFINDTYWLMVPLKVEDPGVNSSLEATENLNGIECEVLHLNFDKVGLTPGDQYWLYVDSATGQIIQWKFLLQNQEKSSSYSWGSYQDLGNGLKLSLKKTNLGNNSSIVFPETKVLNSVNKDIFIKP